MADNTLQMRPKQLFKNIVLKSPTVAGTDEDYKSY